MPLTRAQDIKQLGFDAGFWGIDDATKTTGDKTALDEFLDSYIWEASQRLTDWVGNANYEAAQAENAAVNLKRAMARAELGLVLAEILPVVWARAGAGEESFTFEGQSIRIARTSEAEQGRTIQSILAKAERLVKPWSSDVELGGIVAV
ncbi:MAG: hypothetical protein J0L53_07205 [Spirochaetes bacterium]|nr:hypothetical protein [Spirochaetota bacterium]